MSLQNVQLEFAEAIFSDEHQQDLITPTENMLIYQNNIFASLVRTLKNCYPLLVKLLGEDFFDQAAQEYALRYPSRSANLNDYGSYYSDFLAEYSLTKHMVYLREVAQFEWICHELSTAADHTPMDVDVLHNISADQYTQLNFILNPACRIVKFQYPILTIIDLCHGKIDEEVNIDSGGIDLLLLRRDAEIKLIELSASDCLMLSALHDGHTLNDALTIVNAHDSEYQLDVKLPAWVRDDIIVDCFVGRI